MSSSLNPLVGIPASVRTLEMDLVFHGTAIQYLDAVTKYVAATTFTIPSLEDVSNAFNLLEIVDGVLLTGSFSHIHPSTYGAIPTPDEDTFYDELRDKNSLPLIREIVDRGIPLFGICRGMQEINIAFGGSSHQALKDVPGKQDHRSDPQLSLPDQMLLAHEIEITSGGVLSSIYDKKHVMVNTSHHHGVDRVGNGLVVEGCTDDGTVEAISVKDSKNFALAVQFHPEWHVEQVPFYHALFAAFKESVFNYAREKSSA